MKGFGWLGLGWFGAAAVLGALAGCAAQPAATSDTQAEAQVPETPAPAPEEWVRVGRYSAVAPGPTEVERHPLQTIVQIQYPREIATVRQALQYTLRRSGYKLAGSGVLASKPLPEVHRRLGPMTLEQALETLAGPAFELRSDDLNRTVAFVRASGMTPAERPGPPGSAQSHALAEPASGGSYGPVQPGETLYPIAERLRVGTGATSEQMMLALLSTNPEAFGTVRGEPNVNVLRCGAVLYRPDTEALGHYEPAAAKKEVRRQARLWRRYRPRGAGTLGECNV